MKKIILFLALATGLLAQSPINVQKGGAAGTNIITGDLIIGTGRTLTIGSGGTLVVLSGATFTLPAASVSASLDTLGSTRGDVLYRGASGWTVLAPGTNGQVLNTAGAGADPFWGPGGGGGGSGTVTSVSVTTANGVSGSVATATTTPAITLTLGAITPTSVNSVVLSGSSTPTLAVTGTASISGANTGDQTTISGNAGSATVLQTARLINGVSFNGSANITVTADASTLTNTTLAANVVASSLTSAAGGTFGTNAFNSTAYQPLNAGLTALATGSNFVVFSGPTTANKTFTLPNATSTILTTNAAVTVAQGGTGLASGTSGGIPYFSTTTAMTSSGLLTANALMIGGGAGSAPAVLGSLGTTTTVLHGNAAGAPTFSAISLTADVTGTLPVANGGTGIATTIAYSPIFAGTSGTGVWKADLGPGTTGQVLTSNGAAAYPTWQAPAGGGNVNNSGTPTSGQIAEWTNATTIQGVAVTGSGSVVRASAPTLVNPVLGAATATTLNGLTVTSTSGTLTVTGSKVVTENNTLTYGGTDGSTIAFGTGGTVAYTANNLSVFASTTSAQLAGVLSDETGTGVFVLATSPTLVTPILGTPTSGNLANCTFPTLNQNTSGTASNLSGTPTLPTGTVVNPIADTLTVTSNAITPDLVHKNCGTVTITAGLTINNPSAGTPTNFWIYRMEIVSASAQTLSYDTQYGGSTDQALPTVTYAGTNELIWMWSPGKSKWILAGRNFGF